MAKNQTKNKKQAKPCIPRPMWYGFLIAGIVALICALFLILRWCINAYYVAEAKKGIYHNELEESLLKLNFPDSYVVWYNIGNYHFTKGDFEEAEADYYRALDGNVPYMKECPVKVNLALAMIEQLTDEEWEAFFDSDGSDGSSAEARKVEKTLITARTILIEDGCAHEDDEDGHNEQAQILKDEIDELLQNNDDNNDDEDENDDNNDSDDSGNDDGEGDSDSDGGGSSSREDQIMDHIQDQKEEAQAERAEDQQFYENYYGFGDEQEDGSGNQGGSGSADESGDFW